MNLRSTSLAQLSSRRQTNIFVDLANSGGDTARSTATSVGESTLKRVCVIALAFVLSAAAASAGPITLAPGHTITRVASEAVGLDGLVVGDDGFVYVTDYAGQSLLRARADATNGSFQILASGLANPTDVARSFDGRLFVTASGSGHVWEVSPDGGASVFASGFPFATSIDYANDALYISNSNAGTITKTTLDGTTSTVLSGFVYPYGVTAAEDGSLTFIEFGTGNVLQSDVTGSAPTLLATGSAFGLQFTALSPTGQLFVSDPLTGTVYLLDNGALTPFATGFIGKNSLPVIGPSGIGFNGSGSMFVADGSDLWRIDSPAPVPEPSTLILLSSGVAIFAMRRRRRSAGRQ
jgi:DNA-binding beta-propeller fold protein YncE